MYQLINIHEISEEQYRYYYAMMDEKKREKADRFRFPKDRQRTIAGEMLARQLLAPRCGMPEEALRFAVAEGGKPYVCNAEGHHFNISHSGDYVLCAVSNAPVGADIERIRQVEENLIRYVCTEEELQYTLSDEIQAAEKWRRFFRIWTAKEAYFKYCGTGISDFKQLSIFEAPLAGKTATFYQGEYAVSIYPSPHQE